MLAKVLIMFSSQLPFITKQKFEKLAPIFDELGFMQAFYIEGTEHLVNATDETANVTTNKQAIIGFKDNEQTFSVKFGQNFVEFVTTAYVDKDWHIGIISKVLKALMENGVIASLQISEMQAVNINLFTPAGGLRLEEMIDEHVTLPLSQLHEGYNNDTRIQKYANMFFGQILENGNVKVETLIEQHPIDVKFILNQGQYPKVLPENHIEKLTQMNLQMKALQTLQDLEHGDSYVNLVATASCMSNEVVVEENFARVTEQLQKLGGYSRKEFDEFRCIEQTNKIWEL